MAVDIEDTRRQFLMSEHQLTRQEINATNGRKLLLFQIYLVFASGAYGYVFVQERYYLLPFIGLVATGFIAAWLFEHFLVLLLSAYLLDELEDKLIPTLLQQPTLADRFVGWQHFYGEHIGVVAWFYKFFAVLFFGLVGIGPAVVASMSAMLGLGEWWWAHLLFLLWLGVVATGFVASLFFSPWARRIERRPTVGRERPATNRS